MGEVVKLRDDYIEDINIDDIKYEGIETSFIQCRNLGGKEEFYTLHTPELFSCFNKTVNVEENIKQHHERIASDAKVMIASSISSATGAYYQGDGLIKLFVDNMDYYAQEIFFHEIWHYAEDKILKPDELRIVYKEVKENGDTWNCEYSDEGIERAARAFQHYASARASGLQLPKARKGTAQAVFEKLYEGKEQDKINKKRQWRRVKNICDEITTYAVGGMLIAPIGAGLYFIASIIFSSVK